MKRFIALVVLSLFTLWAWAQWEGCYRLQFADKEGSEFCTLTDRALQRRECQGIVQDERDRVVSPIYLQQLRDAGLEIVTQSRWLNTVVVRQPDGGCIPDASYWNTFPFVTSATLITSSLPVYNASAQIRQISASKWDVEQSMEDVPDNFRNPIQEVHAEKLYQYGYRGEGMLIAILDGGFSYLSNLPTSIMDKVTGWYDCYDRNAVSQPRMFEDHCSNHGTQVFSIMATDTTDGVWGTAPAASYYLIRTEYGDIETQLEEDMWVEGAERADSIGADLINTSLGYHTFDNDLLNASWDDLGKGVQLISQGATIACQKGILVCTSAGNDQQKNWKKIGFPGDVEDVFTVGATTRELTPSSFTSVGWISPYVKPDVSCRGTAAWLINATTGKPGTGNGTSYACPFLCGLMASLWSADPMISPAQLRDAVRRSCSNVAMPDSLTGYGLPNFEVALRTIGIDVTSIAECEAIEQQPESTPYMYDLQGRRTFNGKQNGCFIVQNGKKRRLLAR